MRFISPGAATRARFAPVPWVLSLSLSFLLVPHRYVFPFPFVSRAHIALATSTAPVSGQLTPPRSQYAPEPTELRASTRA